MRANGLRAETQVVEHLHRKLEILGSIPSTARKEVTFFKVPAVNMFSQPDNIT
jgi:hypothetical protein